MSLCREGICIITRHVGTCVIAPVHWKNNTYPYSCSLLTPSTRMSCRFPKWYLRNVPSELFWWLQIHLMRTWYLWANAHSRVRTTKGETSFRWALSEHLSRLIPDGHAYQLSFVACAPWECHWVQPSVGTTKKLRCQSTLTHCSVSAAPTIAARALNLRNHLCTCRRGFGDHKIVF